MPSKWRSGGGQEGREDSEEIEFLFVAVLKQLLKVMHATFLMNFPGALFLPLPVIFTLKDSLWQPEILRLQRFPSRFFLAFLRCAAEISDHFSCAGPRGKCPPALRSQRTVTASSCSCGAQRFDPLLPLRAIFFCLLSVSYDSWDGTDNLHSLGQRLLHRDVRDHSNVPYK